MLRDARDPSPMPPPRFARGLALGGLVLTALALAGFRGPGAAGQAAPAPATGPIELAFVPADTAFVAVVRPAELMAKPELARLLDLVDPSRDARKDLGIAPQEIEQVTIVVPIDATTGPGASPSPGIVVRATKAQDWKGVADRFAGPKEVKQFGEFTYTRMTQGPSNPSYATIDDRTLIVADEPVLIRMLSASPGSAGRTSWAAAWKGIKPGQVAAAADARWLRRIAQIATSMRRAPGEGSPLDAFEPLLSKADAYAVGLDLLNGVRVDALASSRTDADAKQVADTLGATLTLARNGLDSTRDRMTREGQPAPTAAKLLFDLAGPLLAKAEVKVEGKTVRLASSADLDAGRLGATLVPAVQTQRAVAMRAQSVNNLKQIGLAMHNYAAAHNNEFPPAVLLGPDGKTTYSWRVALLPYLEQQHIYSQYHFDEPWDGPNNRKLLDLMPMTYRHPASASKTSSSYYVLTGARTMFQGTTGTALLQITDGTSNTIMAVEAVRDIPWTKPEDITMPPLDDGRNHALPPLGGYSPGGFNALFGDGSVRFISAKINPTVLKALFTRDGGEIVAADAINR